MVVGERYVSVGASVGVALYPADADSVDGLVKLADNAMYRAKRAGKNGYRFASDSGDPHVE
jgi:diguanylate cyclase (GGDEF)-like protein